MAHCNFAFELTGSFEGNADKNDHRCTAEYQIGQSGLFCPRKEDRENRHKGEEYRTHKSNSINYLLDIVRGRLTGTVTKNGAAVLLKVVCNFNRIKGNGEVEVCKSNDENKQCDNIERILGFSREPRFYAILPRREYHSECSGHHNDRISEDDGHNAAHENLDGKICTHTAIHLTANLTLCVLNVKTSFGVGEENGKSDNEEHHDHRKDHPEDVACEAFFKKLIHCSEELCASGNDIGKKDHRDTVTNTLFINLFTCPHYERCAGSKTCNDNYCGEPTVGNKAGIGIIDGNVVTIAGNNCESYGYPTSDLADFSLTFGTALGHTFKSRDRDGKELDNDGCGNVGAYTEREKCTLRERITGQHIEVAEERCTCIFHKFSKFCTVYVGHRNGRAKSVQYENEDSKENSFL